jgi:tripartite ATP-independent transporter DctM subunit
MIGVIMFLVAIIMLLAGFSVAFTFGGLAVIFGVLAEGPELFAFMPYRIWNVMQNTILIAIPLFVFMGLILQKAKIAEDLLESMGQLFGRLPGGLAISTVLVGSLLAASTGVVGASVIAMGIISLPVMLKYHYDKSLATGVICASGTLGQIIPPSIVLIILGDVVGEPVGDLFKAAIIPGLVLIGAYLVYIIIVSFINKDKAPSMPRTDENISKVYWRALKAVIPPLTLIIVVLGSIFSGIATPTESSSVGAVGAILLALFYRRFNLKMLIEASKETVKISAMIFAILIGATAFSMVLNYTGGNEIIENFILDLPGEKWGFIIFSMLLIFILGFFIDFVEISLIFVPLMVPIGEALGIDMLWFAVLIAMNLQSSFLTPPFGFSLFYLRGVADKAVKTTQMYRGVIPFISIQVVVLATIVIFPEFYGFKA